jgi:hypothetical protein
VTGLAPVTPGGGATGLVSAVARDGLLALLTVAILAGAVLLWRRTRDAGAVIIPAYLLLVTIFPIMNSRRTILVLPVLVAWLALALYEGHLRLAKVPLPMPGRAARWWPAGLAALLVAAVAIPTMGVNLHGWRNYREDWNVALLPDRPWLRYLGQNAARGDLVEVFYPRQVYLATTLHADGSLWVACGAVARQGSRDPFDDTLTRLRPRYVVAVGDPGGCVWVLIDGDPEYRQTFVDRDGGVTIWERPP